MLGGILRAASGNRWDLGDSYEVMKQRRIHGQYYVVADGWAGAEMRVSTLSNSIITDGPTDGRTNGRTKPLIELRVRN